MSCKMPEGYLSPEIRDGEALDMKKKKLFKVSIDILEEIKRICERHNLRYFAAYGTLLGAVRHKGFIPWDDDMDLWMPRSDLIRFKQVAQQELSPHYFMQATETEPEMPLDIVKIRDNRTTATVQWQLDAKQHINMGIWVSIFPLDGCPDSDYRAEPIIGRRYYIRFLIDRAFNRKFSTLRFYFYHLLARLVVSVVGIRRLCARRDRFCPKFDKSEKCTSLWCLRGYNEFSCPTAVFKEWIDVPFEYTTIRIPKDYETILCALYGDWHVPIKGSADHEYADLEPDIPWRDFLIQKYGWKV